MSLVRLLRLDLAGARTMDKSYLLSALLPLISLTLCVTFFFLWHRQREKAVHALNWSLAYACAAIGSSLDFARALVENAAPLSFAANVFLTGVAFFAVRGIAIRHSGQASDSKIVPIYAATVVAGVWFCFVHPSIAGRGVAMSVGASLMFLVAWRAIRRAQEIDRIDHLIAWTFVISILLMIARLAVSFIYEGPLQVEGQLVDSFWIVSFKVFAMVSWLAFAILFLLRIATDLMKELSTQSLTDLLTGIPNRRGFFATAEPTIRQATAALPATLMICDIDRFKRVNDTYGHRTGDLVIQGFAEILRHATEGAGCVVGRLGGEEFIVLLPATNVAGARAFAEGIRTAFEAKAYEVIPSSHVITVSIGIAESSGGEGLDALIERADGALYTAKRQGRNRVEVATGEAIPFSGSASLCRAS
ncbi:MAG: GGDEF domain-containing protein [Mesorhizobium sp.]|nr:MAG: GGDEF domain-containing protein [Mesorhizobium sp.]